MEEEVEEENVIDEEDVDDAEANNAAVVDVDRGGAGIIGAGFVFIFPSLSAPAALVDFDIDVIMIG